MARIIDLPVEILQSIFKEYLIICDKNSFLVRYTAAEIVKLTRVCMIWKTVALQTEDRNNENDFWLRVKQVQGLSTIKYAVLIGNPGEVVPFWCGIIDQTIVPFLYDKDSPEYAYGPNGTTKDVVTHSHVTFQTGRQECSKRWYAQTDCCSPLWDIMPPAGEGGLE